jgi:hypothetical protein
MVDTYLNALRLLYNLQNHAALEEAIDQFARENLNSVLVSIMDQQGMMQESERLTHALNDLADAYIRIGELERALKDNLTE